MEAVCVLFDRKTDWKTAKGLLNEGDFLQQLFGCVTPVTTTMMRTHTPVTTTMMRTQAPVTTTMMRTLTPSTHTYAHTCPRVHSFDSLWRCAASCC
jgi:hypothetical protein